MELEHDEEINVLRLMREHIKQDFIFVQGHCLTDLSLLKVIDYHLSNSSAVTVVTKEWDPNQKPKFFLD